MARTYILIDQKSRKVVYFGSEQACLDFTGKEENRDIVFEMEEVKMDERSDKL